MIGIVAFIAIVYIGVVFLYAVSGRVALVSEGTASGDEGLALQISPESVDAVGNRLTLGFDLTPSGSFDASEGFGLALAKPITMLVTDTDGPRTVTFPADAAISPVQVRMLTDGDVQLWPFDQYVVHSVVAAGTAAADGEITDTVPLAWSVKPHRIPGWTFDIRVTPVGDSHGYALAVTAHRSGATVAFGIVLLALMVVMPVIVLTVAIAVYRGRRKMEATLMSWIGAMLFATIPLRGFLPGSPPIGSWIDYLIVLWVIAGLIAGLVIYVAAFLRWAPSATAPQRTPPPD